MAATGGPLELLFPIVRIFEELGIPYVLGGSVASTLFGEPRMTADVDIAIRITPAQASALFERTGAEFYVPVEAARTAVDEHGSFNLVDRSSALEVDIFPLGDGLLDRLQIERHIRISPVADRDDVWVTSPQIQVLRKLDWYRSGGSASDRQWRDVVGLLVVNPELTADEELVSLAEQLQLGELLEGAIEEASTWD
jgi:hypothetical protein